MCNCSSHPRVGYDESDDPELEYSDSGRNEVQCAVTNTHSEGEEEEELRIVEEDEEEVQPRFSETGTSSSRH